MAIDNTPQNYIKKKETTRHFIENATNKNNKNKRYSFASLSVLNK